ncbi:TonB-dependent receptor [Sandarakinorhabdus sp. AAP62]|uniref:TonB-dependent receptor n=1 Tax=Sandarakinorhabdus sp. AAP62 TaxID=1248916 RepID=UPI0003131CE9|nr:TonB-dependent receptor [Sandarakinorhabdus sp. AAP62]
MTTAAAEAAADDEIVVSNTPIRDSIAKAIGIKREAVNIVDAISSDTIGRFPDQTAAAALTRIPAVAVQRDQGQERYIQVRGAPSRWTNVAFDGVNVVGAEDRIFRFDSVPATVVSTLELNKTLTPEMPGEALAGRVNIKTFAPLDNQGLHINADAGLGFVDLGNGPVRSYGGRISWANDRIGILIGGSKFNFNQQTDNYEPRFNAGGMTQVRFAKYDIVRQSNAAIVKLQWQASDSSRITATGLYTAFLDAEQRNQYTFNFAGAASGTRSNTNGDLVAVPVTGLFQDSNYATRNRLAVLHGDHEFSDWKIGWDIAYSKATFSQDLPLVNQTTSSADALLRPSLTFVAGEAGTPVITLFNTVRDSSGRLVRGTQRSALDQTAFTSENLVIFRQRFDQDEKFAKFDVARDWSSLGADAKFTFGFQYNDRTFKDRGNEAILRPDGTAGTLLFRPTAAQLNLPWTPTQLITQESALGRINVGFDVNFVDNPAIRSQVDAILAAANAANAAGGTFAVPRPDPSLTNSVDEKILAAYFTNTWKWSRHTLMIGLRVERAEVDAAGAARIGAVLTPINLSSRNTQYFPSVHYGFDATDELKLRAAFITGTARPSFTDQRATVTINDAAGVETVSGGNPALKPERAWGVDLSAEWYFAPASLLSAGYFYRGVSNVLFDSTTVVGDNRFNFGGVDRSDYQFSTTLNGGDGYIHGAEVAYTQPFTFLPGALSGFGFQGSLAIIDSEFDTGAGRKVPFAGTSKWVTNAALYYEKYGASLRLSWQRRSSWTDEVSPGAAAGDLIWEAQQRLDFSARYDINKYVTLYADATNLTDERGLRYQGSRAAPFELEYFGRRFLFGVRARY